MSADVDPVADRKERQGWIAAIAARRPALTASLARYRTFLAASAAVYALSAVAGFALVGPEMAREATLADAASMDPALGYFVNNAGTAVGLMGGFGVLTLWLLVRNGLALGAVIKVALLKGVPPDAIAASVLPHGVIEVPALLVAGAIGLLLPYRVLSYLRGSRPAIATHEDERHLLQLFLVVLIAIFVAAVVEATVTPPIAGG